MRVHAIKTGRIVGHELVMRGDKASDLIRAYFVRRPYEFPVYAFVVEHDDGHIVVDTGMSHRIKIPRVMNPIFRLLSEPNQEIGPQMRARGLSPEDVRWVIPTHLDVDHAGGIEHFPNAQILVHRPEYEYASTFVGRLRYQPRSWPKWFKPSLYNLNPEPYGPFPESLVLTDRGDVTTLVPIPGHSIAQVAVVIRRNKQALFFGGDHMLRQDGFVEDLAAGRMVMLGRFFPKLAVETSRRIKQFVQEVPTVLVPSHDSEVAARISAGEPLKL